LWGIFKTWPKKKKGGVDESNKGLFGNFKKKKSPYFVKKSLEVARFKQCARAGRQN